MGCSVADVQLLCKWEKEERQRAPSFKPSASWKHLVCTYIRAGLRRVTEFKWNQKFHLGKPSLLHCNITARFPALFSGRPLLYVRHLSASGFHWFSSKCKWMGPGLQCRPPLKSIKKVATSRDGCSVWFCKGVNWAGRLCQRLGVRSCVCSPVTYPWKKPRGGQEEELCLKLPTSMQGCRWADSETPFFFLILFLLSP